MTPTTIIQGNPVTNPKLSSGGFGPWPSQIRRCARIAPCPVVLRHVPTCTLARYPPSLPPCAAAFNKGFQSTPVLFSMASAVRFPRVVRSEQPSASFPRSSPPTRSPRHVRPKMACALPCCASSSAYARAGERAMRITEMGRALRAAHSQRDAGHTPIGVLGQPPRTWARRLWTRRWLSNARMLSAMPPMGATPGTYDGPASMVASVRVSEARTLSRQGHSCTVVSPTQRS